MPPPRPASRGSLVQTVSFLTHRDERWWPDPLRFDPDRFTPERAEALPKMAYFPFGGGPRTCIGMGFALAELSLMLATMLQRVTFALPPGATEPALTAQMSLRPAGEVRLTVRAR